MADIVSNPDVALPQAAPPTVTCGQCGCTSPLTQFFRKEGTQHYCPRCMSERASRNVLMQIFFVLLIGLFLSLLRSRGTGGFQFSGLIEVSLFIVLVLVTMILHEIIHGLTAWLLGGRVFELALGVGEIRRSMWWRGVRFSLRRHIFIGIAICAFPERAALRLRWLIYVLAPLAVQSAFVVFLLFRPNLWTDVASLNLRLILIICNGFLIAVNLFPWKFNAILTTDGYRLWAIFTGRNSAAELHERYFLTVGQYAIEQEDYLALAAAAEAGLALYPESGELKNLQAAAFDFQEQFDKGLSLFDQFLAENPDPAPTVVRALWLCNRAGATYYQHLLAGDITPDRLEVAHASAAEAYSLLPWITPVEEVVAFSALVQGRTQEALDGFQALLPRQEKDRSRAGSWLLIAVAHHHLGQGDAARSALAKARVLETKESRIRAYVEGLVG